MHWHILGAGAIGGLFATRLLDAGIGVTLLLRNQQRLAEFVAAGRQLTLATDTGLLQYPLEAQCCEAPEPIDHLLIATKAYACHTALTALLPRLHADTEILLLQNGCGQQQALAERLPGHAIWAGVTTSGVRRLGPFQLRPAGAGETRIGPLTATAQGLPAGWNRLAHPVQEVADIRQALWQKLAINAAINPLTALYGCNNGALLEPEHEPLLNRLCLEIEQIADAADQLLFEQGLIEQVRRVARDTAANRSSMLEDISAGRRTEIDQITGYLCQQARKYGVTAALNERLLYDIHTLEQKEFP